MLRLNTLILLLVLSVDAFAQHDQCRDSVRLLAKGQAKAAAGSANRKLVRKDTLRPNRSINYAERYFAMAMVSCRQNDIAAAFEYAKKAVDAGLPIERFQAGPRDVFAPPPKAMLKRYGVPFLGNVRKSEDVPYCWPFTRTSYSYVVSGFSSETVMVVV